MASSVIKYDGDSGAWKVGTTTQSAPIKYKLRNGFVTLTASYSNQVNVGTTAVTIITLPEEYRPSSYVYFPIINRAANTPQGAYGYISTNGDVVLTSPTGNISYFNFFVTYPVH